MNTRFASQFLLAAASAGLLSQTGSVLGANYDDVAVDLPGVPLGSALNFLTIQGVDGRFTSTPVFEEDDYFTVNNLLPGSNFTVNSTWVLTGVAFSFLETFTDSANGVLGSATANASGGANPSFAVPGDGTVRGHLQGSLEGGSIAYTLGFQGTPIPEPGTSVAAAAVGLAALLAARRQRAGTTAA